MKPGLIVWHVHVPAGLWMAGVHTFGTKWQSEEFMNKYDETARASNAPVPTWIREQGVGKKVYRGKVL